MMEARSMMREKWMSHESQYADSNRPSVRIALNRWFSFSATIWRSASTKMNMIAQKKKMPPKAARRGRSRGK